MPHAQLQLLTQPHFFCLRQIRNCKAKASLPSSRGGINLRSVVLHAPAAFIASSHSSKSLVEDILGFSPGPSPYMNAAIAALAAIAVRPDWTCLDEVYVKVLFRMLSMQLCIRTSSPQPLRSAPVHYIALSSGLPHAGD